MKTKQSQKETKKGKKKMRKREKEGGWGQPFHPACHIGQNRNCQWKKKLRDTRFAVRINGTKVIVQKSFQK